MSGVSAALGPSVLEGKHVRLDPLKMEHTEGLVLAGKGYDWAWLHNDLSTLESMKKMIASSLSAQDKGEEFPYTVFLKSEERIIGSTRYMDVQHEHKGVEIGGTWYSPSFWGTVVNPECKFLLLRHAFEDWGAIRVQLKTDVKNLHSQNAISKLGAKFEGKLRNHRFRKDGSIRDTMMYSITKEEWTVVKLSLKKRIE